MWKNGQTMSQITRPRRFKKATLLIKKKQYFGRYQRASGCMSSYEKLKNNNNSLAKALSKQRQKGQLLFSQNVALLAEVQDLNLACNKRDNTILKVLQNAKEMLKMLVTMTKFVTNTIASCQEFTSSPNKNIRLSCNPFSRENRRLSGKSPTKGIVKPMISGYPITKPTINLSRINLQHFNNQTSTLSTIEEVSMPILLPENSNANNDNSPVSVPINRQARNTGGRICRMPERLNVTSRASDGDERRSSRENSNHSVRLSERRSGSSRSNELLETNNTDSPNSLRRPHVKLNDVSNLLHSCRTINIRRLGSIQDNNVVNEDIEMNDSTNNISGEQDRDDNNISEMQLTMNLSEENVDESTRNSRKGLKNGQPKLDVQTNSRDDHNNVFNRDDPLEGPSWLLNDYQRHLPSLTNSDIESNKVKNSNKNDDAHECTTKTSMLHTLPCNNNNNNHNNSDDYQEDNKESDRSCSKKNKFKSNTSEKRSVLNNVQGNNLETEQDIAVNNNGFVTRQRGNSTEAIDDDDLDEFTLMFMRRNNNVPFDINDLQLPVLEDSVVKTVVTKEPEPEITTTLQKITQDCEIPSTDNDIENDSLIDQFTVKLPQLSNTTIDCTIPMVDISLDTHQKKKVKNTNKSFKEDNSENITSRKKKSKKHTKLTNDKDPSAVKVVLQKLNDSDVKLQGISFEAGFVENTTSSFSDSESGTMILNLNNKSSPKRPKRQKAPQNLKEPSLTKKLRRLK